MEEKGREEVERKEKGGKEKERRNRGDIAERGVGTASVFPEINQTTFKTTVWRKGRGEGGRGKGGRRAVGENKRKEEGEERLQPDFQPAGPCDIKYFRRPLSLLSLLSSSLILLLSRALPFPRPTALAPPHKTPPKALKGNFTTQTFRWDEGKRKATGRRESARGRVRKRGRKANFDDATRHFRRLQNPFYGVFLRINGGAPKQKSSLPLRGRNLKLRHRIRN